MDATMQCPCPPKGGETRHPQGDTVRLRDRLDYRTVTTIRKAMTVVDTDDPQVRLAERLAICTEFYMLMGIESWTLVDAKGKPVEVSHQAIRDLVFTSPDVESVSEVAEELYNPVVLLPLVLRASASSLPTPTPSPESDDSTSPTSDQTTPPKPLRPSSTSTIRTVATETTTSSPVGASSSSQSAASAA